MARTLQIFLATLALSLGIATRTFADIPALNQPNWDQLSAEQRTILQPLSAEWAAMENYRRKKWVGIAQRYESMTPDEKARVDQRMKEWAKLSPKQRQQARANYKSLKQVPPEHKEDVKRKWDEYSQLPAEQREQLKADAARKPAIKPTPLAAPVRPLQLTTTPASPLVPAGTPKTSNQSVTPEPTGGQVPAPPATAPIASPKP